MQIESFILKQYNWLAERTTGLTWYLVICSVVVVFIGSHTLNQRRQYDFWQHAACIRELAERPLQPEHPIVAIDRPHEFYSPYHVALGWISRFLQIDAIMILSLMTIVNFLLFAVCLWKFVSSYFGNRQGAPISLLLILIFWGFPPLVFSGFPHIQALGDTACYPSFFSLAMLLLVWRLHFLSLTQRSYFYYLPIAFITALVALTHPHTAVSLNIGLGALWIRYGRRNIKDSLALAAVVGIELAAVVLWPYFPFLELVFKGAAKHQHGNWVMYASLWLRYWPLLLALPAVAVQFRRDRLDPLVIALIALSFVYVLAYTTGQYAFGRNIIVIVVILQLLLGQWLTDVTKRKRTGASVAIWENYLFPVTVIVSILFTGLYFSVAIYRYGPWRESTYSDLVFLRSLVPRDSIILADLHSARMVPALCGRVVVAEMYHSFVPETEERQADVLEFFSSHTSNIHRARTLKEYNVDFILINLRNTSADMEAIRSISELATVVYRDTAAILWKVDNCTGKRKLRFRRTERDGKF